MCDVTSPGDLLLPARQLGRWLTAYVVALATATLLTLGVSLCGLRISRAVAIAILVAGMASGFAWTRWSAPREASGAPATGRRGGRWIIAAGFAAYLLLWLLAVLTPDWSCDGNAYHIPPVGMWARAGGVRWVDAAWSSVFNGYPKGLELFAYLLGVTSDGVCAVNAINLVFLPMGCLAVAALARRLGAAPLLALGAGVLVLLVPVHMRQATTTYVDSGFAAAVMAYFAAVVFVADDWLATPTLPTRQALALLGASAGLALGIKASAVAIVAMGAIGLAVVGVDVSLRRGSRTWIQVVRGASAGVALALLVGGAWYLRNYLREGSPLYPVGVRFGGYELFPGELASQAMNEVATTPVELRGWADWQRVLFTWAQGLGAWPRSIDGCDARLGGLGFLWLLGGLPASLFLVVRGGANAFAVRLLAGVVAASFLVMPMHWWARYTVWLHALGLPCLAVCAGMLLRPGSRLGRVWLVVVGLAAAADAAYCVKRMVRELRPGERGNYLFEETRGTRMDDVLTGTQAVAVGPLNSVTARGRFKHNIYGPLSLPLGRRDVFFAGEAGAIVSAYRAGRRFTYVVWDDGMPLPDDLRALAVRVEAVPEFLILTLPP